MRMAKVSHDGSHTVHIFDVSVEISHAEPVGVMATLGVLVLLPVLAARNFALRRMIYTSIIQFDQLFFKNLKTVMDNK